MSSLCIQNLNTVALIDSELIRWKKMLERKNQSRTNGPINAHLTIAQVKPGHNNENQEALLKMSAEAQQYKSTTKIVANAINMYLIYFQPTYGS